MTLIGASTWPGEETLLLKAQKNCIDSGIPCQLIIVPRHVERRGEIQKLLNEQSLPWTSASGDFGNRTSIDEGLKPSIYRIRLGQLIHSTQAGRPCLYRKEYASECGWTNSY